MKRDLDRRNSPDEESKPRKMVKIEDKGDSNGTANGTSHPEKSELSYFIKNPKVISVLNNKGIQRFFPVQYETFEYIYKG